jgi:hypothetical protein
MRYAAVGALVAAAFGIHCSAPTDNPEGTSTSEIAAPAPPHPGAPKPTLTPEPDPQVSPARTSVPGLEALINAGIPPNVTSTVKDAAGAQYITGTFIGTIVIANTALTSKGDKDVFVLKLGPSGGFDWVRAVGSASAERAPRIALAVENDRVSVVGITDGEMDCGAGPMLPYPSETAFLCLFAGPDGASKGSGVFQTGAP